jgi:hypothetical protein
VTDAVDRQDPDVHETGSQAGPRLSPRDRLLSGLATIFVAALAMAVGVTWATMMKFAGIRVGDGTVETLVVVGPPALLCAALIKQGQL